MNPLGQPGTPCISDQDMSAYMQFLHMQQPCPLTVIGVPVELRAITPSGSIIEIVNGTVENGLCTTNGLYGHFSYSWTPPNPGNYTIVARYLGDDSYFPNYGSTGITVIMSSPSPTATVSNLATNTSLMTYIIFATIAIIIAIAVLGVLILRKKP